MYGDKVLIATFADDPWILSIAVPKLSVLYDNEALSVLPGRYLQIPIFVVVKKEHQLIFLPLATGLVQR